MSMQPKTATSTEKATVGVSRLRLVGSPSPKQRVAPRRRSNKGMGRVREHLTPAEVEQLMEAARQRGRHGHRDATLILVAYRHGLRVSELCGLTWDQFDFDQGDMHVSRVKNGKPSTHPISGDELRALRKLRRKYPEGRFVFQTELKGPMTPPGVRQLIARIGVAAGMPWPVHPHMLRHACGFKLANDGQDTRALQDYLGHRNIQHTVRYTELAAGRFKDFWREPR